MEMAMVEAGEFGNGKIWRQMRSGPKKLGVPRRTKAQWCRICSQIITNEVATVNAAWDINTSHDTPFVS